MNEAETRAELIDPKLKASGWGVVTWSLVFYIYIQINTYSPKLLHWDFLCNIFHNIILFAYGES